MADHYIDVVNQNDEIIGKELKRKKPELNFISRVVAIMVKNSEGEIIVCKRGSHKKIDFFFLPHNSSNNLHDAEPNWTRNKKSPFRRFFGRIK